MTSQHWATLVHILEVQCLERSDPASERSLQLLSQSQGEMVIVGPGCDLDTKRQTGLEHNQGFNNLLWWC